MVTGMVIVLVIVSGTTMETQTETTTSTHRVSNSLIAYLSLMCPIMCAALYLTHSSKFFSLIGIQNFEFFKKTPQNLYFNQLRAVKVSGGL